MKKKNVFNFEKNKKRALKTMVSDLCKSVQKMTVYKRCKLEFKRGETAKVYNLENGEKGEDYHLRIPRPCAVTKRDNLKSIMVFQKH